MPWKAASKMELIEEFVKLSRQSGISMAELCRRFGVSRKTGYKWLGRAAADGVGLAERSRRPLNSPGQTTAELEQQIVALRGLHPAWGGRKLRQVLLREGIQSPAASTITAILRRHGLLSPQRTRQAWQRFEHAAPNDLWQMDFKGHFGLSEGGSCHPLTVLDDHSRYSLVLAACTNQLGETVQTLLSSAFRRYGLPRTILADNGSPWGDGPQSPWTWLSVWLMKQGIRVTHGRPYHPQTQGKEERFHRTLKAEVLQGREFANVADCQRRFDPWRQVYNYERPHEAIQMQVPGSRYRPSDRSFVEHAAAWEYGPDDQVRKVQHGGWISFRGREWRISKAFHGEQIGLRPTSTDGVWEVWYRVQGLGELNQHACENDYRMTRRGVE
jgi:transposase InsO family protein